MKTIRSLLSRGRILLLLILLLFAVDGYSLPRFTGKLLGPDNAPISAASVAVLEFGSLSWLNSATVGQDGAFSLQAPSSTSGYVIKVYDSHYPTQYYSAESMLLAPPQFPLTPDTTNGVTTLKIVLSSTPPSVGDTQTIHVGAIIGQVKENNVGMSGLALSLVNQLNIGVDTATTTEYGEYTFYNAPADVPLYIKVIPGNGVLSGYPQQYYAGFGTTLYQDGYSLKVSPYNTITVPSFSVSASPDSTLGVRIDFAVSLYDEAGNPLTGAGTLSILKGSEVLRVSKTGGGTSSQYLFSNIPSGNLSLQIALSGYPDQYYHPEGNTTGNFYEFSFNGQSLAVTVLEAPSETVNGGEITGVVRTETTSPIAGAEVILFRVEDSLDYTYMEIPSSRYRYKTETGSGGSYTFSGIPEGNYFAFVSTPDQNYKPEFYPTGETVSAASPITVTGSSTVTADFTLKGGSLVRGYIKDVNGLPLSGFYIHSPATLNSASLGFSAVSNTSGRFELKGLPAGEWYYYISDSTGFWSKIDNFSYDGAIVTDGKSSFDIPEDIRMRQNGKIAGSFSGVADNYLDGTGHIYALSDTFAGYLQFRPDFKGFDSLSAADPLFEYPLDYLSLYNAIYIDAYDTLSYRSGPIPPGKFKLIYSPPITSAFRESSLGIEAGKRWSFIDGATSFDVSSTITVSAGRETIRNLSPKTGGYMIKVMIAPEGGEIVKPWSQDQSQTMYLSVYAFVKDSTRGFIKVSESEIVGENTFALAGLKAGEKYYFYLQSSGYPQQWFVDSTAIPTADPGKAGPFVFSASAYTMPVLKLVKSPEDYDVWGDEVRPDAIENLTMATVGLKTIKVTWRPSPLKDNVVKYRVYRIEASSAEAIASLFSLNSHDEYEPVDNETIMDYVDSIDVVDTLYYDNNVKTGKSYMYVVLGINSDGKDGHAFIKGEPLSSYITNLNFRNFTLSDTLKSDNWVMVSTPGLSSEKFPLSTKGETHPLYRWDESSDSSGLFSHYEPQTEVKPRLGYWLYPLEKVIRNVDSAKIALLFPKVATIRDTLEPGWNQVGNPFPYPVICPASGDTVHAHGWDSKTGGYVMTDILQPWRGYWFYSDSLRVITYSPVPAEAVSKSRSRSRGVMWELKLVLSDSLSSDSDNYIGCTSYDRVRGEMEPPRGFSGRSLSIYDNGTEYASRYLPLSSSDVYRFTLLISPSEHKGTLKVFPVAELPDGFALYRCSEESEPIQLDPKGNLTIPPSSRNTTIELAVGPVNSPLLIGNRFSFQPNFPNPFGRITTFSFTIPGFTGNTGYKGRNSTSLILYTLSGKKAAVVFQQRDAVPGKHRISFDGSTLAPGVYLAQLKCGDAVKNIRIMKVK